MSHLAVRFGLICLWLIHFLPLPVISMLGQALGWCIYQLPIKRRRIAARNLELCFSEQPSKLREQWVKNHFMAYGRAILEYGVLVWGSKKRIMKMVKIEGLEHFLAQRDKPVIVFAPHFIGLNAGGIRLGIEYEGASIYARQSNPVLDQWIRKGRERFGKSKLILRTEGIRGLIRMIKQGLPVYYLPDMDLGAKGAVFVPFFGVPAATIPALSRMVKMTGAVIVPCITWQEAHGQYRVQFFPAWDWTGDEAIEETMQMHHFLETQIRFSPWQYLWTHQRFKTRPSQEKSLYQ